MVLQYLFLNLFNGTVIFVYNPVLVLQYLFTNLFWYCNICLQTCFGTAIYVYTPVLVLQYMFTNLFGTAIFVNNPVLVLQYLFTNLFWYCNSCCCCKQSLFRSKPWLELQVIKIKNKRELWRFEQVSIVYFRKFFYILFLILYFGLLFIIFTF